MNADEAALAREPLSPPLTYLPRPILEPRRPAVALAVAWATTFVPSVLIGALISAFAPQATQPEFHVRGAFALFALVVFAPVLETLIMGGVLLVLLRLFSPTVAVVASALGWGIAHSLAAPAWGLVIWWPFLVFSSLFVVWRQRSLAAAFALPAAAHALHNLLPAIVVAAGVKV